MPVGAFRTWVKYIEKGEFPDTKRFFAVLRCNQCDDAPCIPICPTNALFERKDGVVDFDNSKCIGCKSCMQACPYDALYIDPVNKTAAKCHFCAHRVEKGLEPACAIVCPTQAIITGDLDDPTSKISKIISSTPTQVRKPEKETKPKVFYVGAEQTLLNPDMQIQDHASMVTEGKGGQVEELADVRITYDIDHPKPWGIKIAAYLWTKSIAAGVILMAIFFGDLTDSKVTIVAPIVSLFFLGLTGALLIFDLKRPDRFWYIILKPNFSSWLVIGTYIILIFGAVTLLWLYFGLVKDWASLARMPIPAGVFAVMTACYSAFLFHQARGRDLWLSNLLFIHLLFAALVAGSAVFVLLKGGLYFDVLAISSALLFSINVLDHATHHVGHSKRASAYLLGASFYFFVVLAGFVLPVGLWFAHSLFGYDSVTPVIASIGSLVGLLEYERLWIKAGQSVSLS